MQNQSCTSSLKAITTQGGCTHATSTGARTKPKPTGAAESWRHNPGVHGIGASSAPAPVATDTVAQFALGFAVRRRPQFRDWHEHAIAAAREQAQPVWLRSAGALARGEGSPSATSEVRLVLAALGRAESLEGDEDAVLRLLIS